MIQDVKRELDKIITNVNYIRGKYMDIPELEKITEDIEESIQSIKDIMLIDMKDFADSKPKACSQDLIDKEDL